MEQLGISEILSSDKITTSMGKFYKEETDLTYRRIAKLIESEVLSTPWNLSSSFIKVKSDMQMMNLEGIGDPSFGHGGYSFIKMPLKIGNDSLQEAKANRMILNPAIKNPKAVTKTDADLRKLRKAEIYDMLVNKMGIAAEQLKNATRWQMVGILRHHAPNQKENQKYARGVRNTSDKQRDLYNKQQNKHFEKQMKNLSKLYPDPEQGAQSEDEPDFTNSDFPQTKVPGQNAQTYFDAVKQQKEDSKLTIEVSSADVPEEITKIEDIPSYLNLLLLKVDKLPVQQTIGSASQTQITSDFIESLTEQGIQEIKELLEQKIMQGEVSKNCKVIFKKIRSLTQSENEERRIVFSTQEKMIKRFLRARNKNKPLKNLSRTVKPKRSGV